MSLVIDPEFKSLIPPLAPDELAHLESSLLSEGCRDALVVWDGHNVLVDGHNRYELCQKHNLPYKTVGRQFDSRADVVIWMVQNQFARRNLQAFVRGELALRMESAIAEKASAKKAHGQTAPGKNAFAEFNKSVEPVHTRKELAKAAETSEDTIRKVKHVTQSAPEPIKQAARAGDISTHRAFQITQQLEKLPPEHRERAAALSDDELEKYAILVRLYKSMGSPETNGTYEEIIRAGGFHYGRELEKWCDFTSATIQDITKALQSIADHHMEQSWRQNGQTKPSGVPKALQMSESNEWYTPSVYIEAARLVMGGIDIDPASNPTANQVVQAKTYYTIETNGLDKDWRGNVWLNPPYGREGGDSNQDVWSARLVEQYQAGITTQAVLLVNAVTDRKWFQPLWEYPICFTDHRIKFYDTNGEAGQPTHGNALVYFGRNIERFADVFSQFGVIAVRWNAKWLAATNLRTA